MRLWRLVLLGAIPLALALPIAALVIEPAAFLANGVSNPGVDALTVAIGILGNTAVAVGVVILWRRPGNVIGALLLLGALLLMITFLAWPTAVYRGAVAGPDDVVANVAIWWGVNSLLVGVYLLFPSVGILFPDGRLPSPRWRLPFAGVTGLLVASVVIQTFAPWPSDSRLRNPLALPGVPKELGDLAGGIAALAVFIGAAMAVVAVTSRFRRSTGVEHAQLKWLVASVVAMAITFPLSYATDVGPASLIDIASVVAGCLIPVAVGIAILRYRLYDIDRVVSRTIAYGLITAILLMTYAAAILVLQEPLATITGSDTVLVALSTLVVAAVFQPLRHRVQRAVDRRFDRARYDAERTAATFSERLRDEVDIAAVTGDLDRTVRDALKPSALGLWLREGG